MDDMTAEQGGAMWAYGKVRAAILSGDLPPGGRVSQVQLADRLGIGRPTLREALRMLQNEGLIRAEHNRQVRVAPLELGDFEDLCALRLAVEPMAVRLSVPLLTDEDLVQIITAEQETSRLNRELDFVCAAASHQRFHSLMFSHAGERVRRTADDLWQTAERYRRLMIGKNDDLDAVARLADADHAAIRRAAEDRDGAVCADLVAQHISKVSTVTLSLIDSSHDSRVLRTATSRIVARSHA
ncbi:GntR family transcriptional regulator [Mycolicibacterium stellerae]|uniref:GntR family transcriptional regulator n=1 Tax=Mycolicibacterium stellerae TaxID=2358193 RepID=UPI0013DDFF40|nr:GntR family transcriptional regulator [Mycolicibacterium stellerae]